MRPIVLSVALTNLADGVLAGTVPLIALQLTDSPFLVAAVVALQQAPFILFGLPSGAIVDRLDQRWIMAATTAARVVVALLLFGFLLAGGIHLAVLYAAVLLTGTAELLFDVAASSLLPNYARRDSLAVVNSWLASAELVVGRIVGPIVGTLLFALGDGTVGLGLTAALLVVALSSSAQLMRNRIEAPPTSDAPIVSAVAVGVKWVGHRRIILVLMAASVTMNLCQSSWFGILAIYVVRHVGLPASSFGGFLAIGAVGGLLGSTLSSRYAGRFRITRVLPSAMLTVAVTQLVLGLESSLPIVAGTFALLTAADSTWSIHSTTLRQQLVPVNLLGRVNAIYRMVGRGSTTLGALIGGVVATRYGITTVFITGAPVLLLMSLLLFAWLAPWSPERPSVSSGR